MARPATANTRRATGSTRSATATPTACTSTTAAASIPYRDWVVRAFNDNLPLDEFITWQLAGDLLPDPTLEQQVATGFVRMNPTTAEGGAIPEEFQAKNNFDRTETLGTVLLGMTLTCARCHTHKYDPITQTEYYSLLAFFNSTAEGPMDGNKYDYGPVAKAPADQAAWEDWSQLLAERDQLLNATRASPGTRIAAEAALARHRGKPRLDRRPGRTVRQARRPPAGRRARRPVRGGREAVHHHPRRAGSFPNRARPGPRCGANTTCRSATRSARRCRR